MVTRIIVAKLPYFKINNVRVFEFLPLNLTLLFLHLPFFFTLTSDIDSIIINKSFFSNKKATFLIFFIVIW